MSSKVYLLSIVFAYEGSHRGFRLTNYLIFLFWCNIAFLFQSFRLSKILNPSYQCNVFSVFLHFIEISICLVSVLKANFFVYG